MLKITSAASSNIGKVKLTNDDNFYLNESFLSEGNTSNGAVYTDDASRRVQYYAVFDGFDKDTKSAVNTNTQFEHGYKASEIAAEELFELQKHIKKQKEYDLGRLIHTYVGKTNKAMNLYTKESRKKIGASFALLCIDAGIIKVYNIGNVKVFLLRENRLMQVSTDDTKIEAFVAARKISEEAARHSPENKILTQHFGINENEAALQLHVNTIGRIQNGDKFLLCSDSICEYITKQKLHHFMSQDISEQEILTNIMTEANRQGGTENYTALTVEVVNTAEPANPNRGKSSSNDGGLSFIKLNFRSSFKFKPRQLKAAAALAGCVVLFIIAIVFLIKVPLKDFLEKNETSTAISGDGVDEPTENASLPTKTTDYDLTETTTSPFGIPTTIATDENGNPVSNNGQLPATTQETGSDTQDTATLPQDTTNPQNNTTAPPQTTTAPPATTTAPPQTTTAAPQTTTTPPQTTTAAPTTTEPPTTTTEPTTTEPQTTETTTEPTTTEPVVTTTVQTEPVTEPNLEETVSEWEG